MNIAIVGATGIVGKKMLDILESKQLRANYFLFASSQSAGSKVDFMGIKYKILNVETIVTYQLDYAIFVSNSFVATTYIPLLSLNGTTCIDNSSAFRLKEDVPLIVTEINAKNMVGRKIVANPNCTTIQLAIVLNALKDFGIKRVVCSTYQAVSGAGKKALADLQFATTYGNLQGLTHPITDNIIPHIGDFCSDGYTKEEKKVIEESRKILALPTMNITCNAVRVPVTNCHGIYLNVELDSDFTIEEVTNKLKASPTIAVYDNTQYNQYPMPIIANNTPFVYVGRLHKDQSNKNTLECFIVADNLMRGASYNAYEILIEAIKNEYNI